ncbi:hypothetical protein M405DRAFT_818677 [Rhizopogon salebrosus TDB-379]|nr:hypothetical protein M405DRAFT_818677 [Rhizopogon salebrosus TDB-379]
MELDQEVLRAAAWREARRDGTFAGLTSGLAGALVGSKLMGFGRNKTILCGALTGLLSGYFFTQAFLTSNMARLRSQSVLKDAEADPSPRQ